MNTTVYAQRLARAKSLLHTQGLDYLLVGPSADMFYLIGAKQRPSERLSLLVIPQEGPAHMVLPGFEAASLPELPSDVQVATWGESDNPARLVANLITGGSGGGNDCTIGVSDRVWSVFLLHIQAELPRAAFTHGSRVLNALRLIKTPEEAALLRQSGAAADEVFQEIIKGRFAGRTEKQIAQEMASLLKARGLDVEGLHIVASGPNSASPHHHTGERVVQSGDVVVLDFGGTA